MLLRSTITSVKQKSRLSQRKLSYILILLEAIGVGSIVTTETAIKSLKISLTESCRIFKQEILMV